MLNCIHFGGEGQRGEELDLRHVEGAFLKVDDYAKVTEALEKDTEIVDVFFRRGAGHT